ncbi:MAG: outer membrane lipoprotein LolB [Rubrivivax sp.]|nr:MAG: outer membrane lipoprotein LolB [Rubrivivax sp.]
MSVRRRASLAGLLASALWLAGCAAPQSPASVVATGAPGQAWSGRLALQVESSPPQSLSAVFDLKGSPQAGELVLTTPLGSTLARMAWAPGAATLQTGNDTRQFESVDALVAQVTGTSVPVPALFEWLAGRPADADGWSADLSQYAQGRLQASRQSPAPVANLRLVLER